MLIGRSGARLTEIYDTLGQVTSGKKYWSDGTPVAGEQFAYAYDDIGNRKFAALPREIDEDCRRGHVSHNLR